MPARRLSTNLPAMTLAEAIETTRIHRVAGLTGDRTALVTTRPFRAPSPYHLGCGADRRGPRADAGGGKSGGSSRLHARHPTLDGPDICAQLLRNLLHG
jgi:Magnesium chelatase, subunit ChlI